MNTPAPDAPPSSSPPVSWLATTGVSVAAPAILLGAATVYFSGTVYRDNLLGYFGLPGAALQESLQATMAKGYLAVLTALVLMVPGFITGIMSGYLRVTIAPQGSNPFGFISRHRPVLRVFLIFVTFALFAGAGWYAGTRAADIEYGRLKTTLAGGCRGCFLYNTVRGRAVGLPIGQDTNVIILATRHGAAVLPASGIRAVRPINARPAAPNWKWIVL